MKAFVIQLLSIIFVVLITGSIQSVTADHSEPDQGIFKNEQTLQELEATKDSNYQIHLQTVLRNGDGQLISVIEGTHGFVIPHQISDHVFDTLMGKKEIVTIDDIKYEKVQYTFSPTLKQRWMGIYPIFDEIDAHLDAPNAESLAKIVEERSEGSQFIMVSLKDSVVEKAKLIYGVYPKNGISHIVTYKDKRLPAISTS